MNLDHLFQVQYEYWRKASDHPQGGYRTMTSVYIIAPNLDDALERVRTEVGSDLMGIQTLVQLDNEEVKILT